jgi:hypothetical protein
VYWADRCIQKCQDADQIKENELGGTYSTNERKEKHKMLVGKRHQGTYRRTLECNIKMDLKRNNVCNCD